VHDDQAGIEHAQCGVVEVPLGSRPGLKFSSRTSASAMMRRTNSRPPLVRRSATTDALLRAIDDHHNPSPSTHAPLAHGVAAVGRLDLDDLCAEIAEHLAANGPAMKLPSSTTGRRAAVRACGHVEKLCKTRPSAANSRPSIRGGTVTKFLKDFRKFAIQGDLLQMATAFIIGLYFKGVIDSFTNGIVLAFVSAIFGKVDFASIGFTLNNSRIAVGLFILIFLSAVIIGSLVLYVMSEAWEGMRERMRLLPDEDDLTLDQELLTEIRDLLRTQQGR
jgi:large conductance mechanosensitive channel